MSRSDAADLRSDGVRPGRSAFVESAMRSATPLSPSWRRRVEVGGAAVDRGRVELEVAGVDDRAVSVCDDGHRVGHRVRDGHGSASNGPTGEATASGPISTEFGADEQPVLVRSST